MNNAFAPAPAKSALAVIRSRMRHSCVIMPIAIGLALTGCASPKKTVSMETTGSIAQTATPDDLNKAVAYWGDRYQKNENDRETALNYAEALRQVGRNDQAVAVLQKATLKFTKDREILAAYGKALAANGDLQRALDVVQEAQTPEQPDWKLMSAEAAIRDQLGQHAAARKLYAQSLQIAPNEPSTLSNYGMSYVLTGELPKAEKLLRQAIAQPGADSRIRQNLALVIGLQGRFDEAQRIARTDLSPQQAAANMAYLKSMLSQQDSWQKLKAASGSGGGNTG